MAEFLVIGIAIVVLTAVFWYTHLMDQKRAEEMEALAKEWGFIYIRKPDSSNIRTLGTVEFFEEGHSQKWRNLLTKKVGDQMIQIFDYHYTTGSGKSRTHYEQSVFVMTDKALKLPKFSLSPEGFFDQVGSFFGFKDIDFDEDPEFSKEIFTEG